MNEYKDDIEKIRNILMMMIISGNISYDDLSKDDRLELTKFTFETNCENPFPSNKD